MYSAYMLSKDDRGREWQKSASLALLAWGIAGWFGTAIAEISDRVTSSNQLHGLLLFGSLSLAGIAYAGKRFDWIACRRVSLALLPALFIGVFAYLFEYEHFFEGLGALGWLLAIVAHVFILYVHEGESSRAESAAHGFGAIFFVGLIAYELGWQLDRILINDVWAGTAGFLVLAGGAFVLLFEKVNRNNDRWPFSKQPDAYFVAAILMVLAYVVLVTIVSVNDPGDPAPLPYIPILNPLDVLSIVAVALLWYAMRFEQEFGRWGLEMNSRGPRYFLAGVAFTLSTIAVVRIVHHITGVSWYPSALVHSVSVQSTLSIYWAILGLSGMVLGARRNNRIVWMVGAALMVVVVLKLFVIDLGNTGTVARIISFLGVGVMLLVVGYFSPVPPKQSESATAG
jgi:uncharacterized membrane protein